MWRGIVNGLNSTWRAATETIDFAIDAAKAVGYHSAQLTLGLYDGLRIDKPIRLLFGRSEEQQSQHSLRSHFLHSFLLNAGLLLSSTVIFSTLILPILKSSGSGWGLVAELGFDVSWFAPAYVGCYYANLFAYQGLSRDLATQNDIPIKEQSLTPDERLKQMGLVAPLVALSSASFFVALIGPVVSFSLSSIVASFFAVGFRWNEEGLTLKDQINTLDNHWGYFLGFGSAMTALSFFCPELIGLALFNVGFPFLMANSFSTPLNERFKSIEKLKPERKYLQSLPFCHFNERLFTALLAKIRRAPSTKPSPTVPAKPATSESLSIPDSRPPSGPAQVTTTPTQVIQYNPGPFPTPEEWQAVSVTCEASGEFSGGKPPLNKTINAPETPRPRS